jgi:hypothetical protein
VAVSSFDGDVCGSDCQIKAVGDKVFFSGEQVTISKELFVFHYK